MNFFKSLGAGRVPAVAFLLLLSAWCLSGCGGGGPDDANPVMVTVSVDPAAVEPGGQVTLLWRFAMAADWHLYWVGRNDSGFAPEIELVLPPGWVAGGLQWPAPERLVLPGGILDHVYHGEVTLLQRLGAPDDAVPGAALEIGARVRWLACKDSCVPGQAPVELVVPVVARVDAPPSPGLAQAKRRLPDALPADLVTTRWEGATFHIGAGEAAPAAAARELVFMPTVDCGEMVDLLADGVGPQLALRFTPQAGTAGPVRGLLLIEDGAGGSRPYTVDFPAIVLAASETGK